MEKMKRGTDHLVRMKGPVNQNDGTSINDDDYANVTCVFQVFDERKEHRIGHAPTILMVDADEGASSFTIPYLNPELYGVGNPASVVGVTLDDGSEEILTINSSSRPAYPPAAASEFDTFGTTSTIPRAASAGNAVRLISVGTNASISAFHVIQSDLPFGPLDDVLIRSDAGIETAFTLETNGHNHPVVARYLGSLVTNHPVFDVIVVDADPTFTIDVGSSVSRLIKVPNAAGETMTIYPATATPSPYVAGQSDWGYKGTLKAFDLADTSEFKPGQIIHVRIKLDGDTSETKKLKLEEHFDIRMVER